MLRGGQTLVEFEVRNERAIPTGPLELRLPDAAFLRAASPVSLPSLNVGESTNVSLLLQPASDQELTFYSGSVVIAGGEASLSLPFNFRAVSEAVGNLSLSVEDELTYFAEGSPLLGNATITLMDPFSGAVIFSEKDADGVLQKQSLAEGYYKLRVTADNHDSYEQTFYLGAGETESIQAFLSRQTVKYIWTVTPTEIEDKYTISIESVFETDVPIPVVTIDPPLIDLQDLQVVGQVMQMNMTLTNHGLITANDIKLDFGSHPFYRIEPLLQAVDSLTAKSSLAIPVRITRINDFADPNPGGGSGGGGGGGGGEEPGEGGDPGNGSNPSTGIGGGNIDRNSPVSCSLFGVVQWSYPCGETDVTKSTQIVFGNVEGNCAPGLESIDRSGGGVPRGDFGGGGGGIYSSTPIITNSDCCEPYSTKVGFSPFLKPFVSAAESAINGYLTLKTRGLAQIKLEANGSLNLTRCCPTGKLVYSIEGDGSGKVIIGKSLIEQDFELAVPGSLLVGSPFQSISLSGKGEIGINVIPSIQISGKSGIDCNGLSEDSVTIKIGIDFNAGMSGRVEANAIFDVINNGPSVEVVDAQGGLKGGLSYTYFYSSNRGSYECFESSGLFLEAYATAFGYTFSPFDDITTTEVETKSYFIDPIPCEVPTALYAESMSHAQVNPGIYFANLAEYIAQEGEDIARDQLGSSIISTSDTASLPSVCARVSIKIDQDAVMTRNAFIGNLEIENGNSTSLHDLSIVLQIHDQDGKVVNEKLASPLLSLKISRQ